MFARAATLYLVKPQKYFSINQKFELNVQDKICLTSYFVSRPVVKAVVFLIEFEPFCVLNFSPIQFKLWLLIDHLKLLPPSTCFKSTASC